MRNYNIVFNRYTLLRLEEPIIKNEIKHRYCLIPKMYPLCVYNKTLRYALEKYYNITYQNYNHITFSYFQDLQEVRKFAKLVNTLY